MKESLILILAILCNPGSALSKPTENLLDSFCSIRPTSSLCHWSSVNIRTRRQLGGSGDEFCDGNKNQFGNSCNDRFSDNGQNDFCSTYGVRCRGWKKVPQPQNPPPQSAVPQPQPQPQPKPIPQSNPVQQPKPQKPQRSDPHDPNNINYCQKYGSDYYKLCLRGSVPDFASTFCNSFKPHCPGVPDPGTLVGSPVNLPAPSKPAPNSLPPQIPPSPLTPPVSNPVVPAAPVLPASPQLPAGGLPSLPANPSLPAGGLPSLPANPSLPAGGLPSLPASPTGGLPSIPQQPQLGGQTPGGIGVGSGLNAPFFGGQTGTNISPLSGVGTGTNLNAAGVGVGASNGVNFGGLPFLNGINQAGGLGSLGAGGFGR